MDVLSRDEAREWLRKCGLGPERQSLRAALTVTFQRVVPSDCGRKAALSRTLGSLFAEQQEVLLFVTEYGVWQSAEDWHLFDTYRRGLGINSPIWESPGHVVFIEETDELRTLLLLALYFVWDATVVAGDGSFAVELSHDEVLDVYAYDPVRLATAQGLVDRIVIG